MQRPPPPIHAEHVGSLMRPQSLIAALGERYIQLDEVNLAFLYDPKLRDAVTRLGKDPDTLPRTYARLINDTVGQRPDDMVACLHLCRGSHRANWVAEGGYEPVAETLFNEIDEQVKLRLVVETAQEIWG